MNRQRETELMGTLFMDISLQNEVSTVKEQRVKTDRHIVVLGKILSLFLLFFLVFGCAHNRHNGNVSRLPSSKEDCLKVFKNFMEKSRPEADLRTEVKKRLKDLKNGKGYQEFTEFVTDLQEEVLTYQNSEFEEKWRKIYSLKQIIGENLRQNKEYVSEIKQLQKLFNDFLAVRQKVRGPRVAYTSQARVEMFRFMMDTPDKLARSIPEKQRIEEFVNFVALREFTSGLSERELKDSRAFTKWFLNNGTYDGPSNQTMEELYHREFSRFQLAYRKMSNKEKVVMEREGKEKALKIYNDLSLYKLSPKTTDKELKRGTLQLIQLFSILDPQFRRHEFLEWLFKEGELDPKQIRESFDISRQEGFDLMLGDYLRQSYKNFAAFQEVPLAKEPSLFGKARDKIKRFWKAFDKEGSRCQTLDCVNKKSRSMWSDFFSYKTFKNSMSCLSHNPVALKTMFMDIGLIWGGLFWHYRNNKGEFQRFPFEIIANGVIFAPILAEANCRASFKSALPFGGIIPEDEVFASVTKRGLRTFKNFRSLVWRGILSSMGLIGMTAGIDHLLLVYGVEISKPLAMSEIIIMIPAAIFYHGLWSSAKQMVLINPLRHKYLPKLAEIISRKSKNKKAYWAIQSLLDFGAFKGASLLSTWDYLNIYRKVLFPTIAGSFTAGVMIEHKRSLSPTGEELDSYEGVTESGLTTSSTIKEKDGKIILEGAEVEIPDSVIEEWADQIIEKLP